MQHFQYLLESRLEFLAKEVCELVSFWFVSVTEVQSPPEPSWSPVGSCSFLLPYTHVGSSDTVANGVGPVDVAGSSPVCFSAPVMINLPYFLRRAVRTEDALNIWSQLFERHRDHTFREDVKP